MNASLFSPAVREIVRQRSMGRCERCSTTLPVDNSGAQMHHRLPRGAGGSKNPLKGRPSNALHLCLDCHAYVETNAPLVFINGWKVKHGQSPANVPVLLATPFGRGFWLLDDTGCYLPADPVR